MLTELTDWEKVYVLQMASRVFTNQCLPLKREHRLVARFRFLLCKSAEGQRKWKVLFCGTCEQLYSQAEQVTMEEAIEEYFEEHQFDENWRGGSKGERVKWKEDLWLKVWKIPHWDEMSTWRDVRWTKKYCFESFMNDTAGAIAKKYERAVIIVNGFWRAGRKSHTYDFYENLTVRCQEISWRRNRHQCWPDGIDSCVRSN